MIQMQPSPSETIDLDHGRQIRAGMHQIERRQWWLWSSAVLVMLLLCLGIASFAFPALMTQAETFSSFYFGQTVRGLIGVVLLFNVYTIYQQLQIHRIHRQLADQVEALGKMEVRTDEVYQMAVLDPLTGLYNRRYGQKRLAEEISRAQRKGEPLTVLLLDIDHLKEVNDKFGHAAGDELIRQFSERVNRAIRGSDIASRVGGDEFLVLLPECQPEDVSKVLERLNGMRMNFDGHTIPVTCSAGWTDYAPGELPEDLVKRADAALYSNKGARKGELRPSVVVS
jgi:diguanylate cyclase (GGDEF)-like protein